MAGPSPHPIFYGVPAETISQLCGVTLRQARAYKRGTAHVHASVIQLVTLHIEGRILDESWAGWSAREGNLNDPEGRSTSQSMLRAYAFVWQLARELAAKDPVATQSLDRIAGIATARLELQRRRNRAQRDRELVPKMNTEGRPHWRTLDASDPAHPPRKRATMAR